MPRITPVELALEADTLLTEPLAASVIQAAQPAQEPRPIVRPVDPACTSTRIRHALRVQVVDSLPTGPCAPHVVLTARPVKANPPNASLAVPATTSTLTTTVVSAPSSTTSRTQANALNATRTVKPVQEQQRIVTAVLL